MDSQAGRSSHNFEELEMQNVSPCTSDNHSISPLSRVSTHSATQLPPETEIDGANLTSDLGAWSRYPSHTREKRTWSAGAADNIITRDFAFELHVQPTDATDIESEDDATTSKQSKVKKRKSNMSKSKSLNLPKQFLKNYARMFKSQSQEFLGHGHGHRTSISAGGLLSHPELEILPDMWAPLPLNDVELANIQRRPSPMHDEATDAMRGADGQFEQGTTESTSLATNTNGAAESKPINRLTAKLRRKHSKSTGVLRPESAFDGATESKPDLQSFIRKMRAKYTKNILHTSPGQTIDQARLWSQIYESCVEHPRFSTENFDSDAPEKVMGELLAASIAREYSLGYDSAEDGEMHERNGKSGCSRHWNERRKARRNAETFGPRT